MNLVLGKSAARMTNRPIEFNKSMRLAGLISVLIMAVMFFRILSEQSWPIRHDCSVYVRAAELILRGERPYVDFIDINPPLVMYLMVLPVEIGKLLHIGSITSFNVFVFLLVLISWLCVRAFSIKEEDSDNAHFFPSLLIGFALSSFLIAEWHEYGQRAHLFSLAMIPFFLVRRRRWLGLKVNPAMAALIGFCTAVTLCIRPPNALILASPELYWLWTKRKATPLWAIEIISGVASFVLYTLALVVFMPDTFSEWTTHIAPIVLKGYPAYDHPITSLLLLLGLYGIGPVFLICMLSARKQAGSLKPALLALTAGAIVLYIIELKAWTNHIVPALCAACVLGMVQLTAMEPAKLRQWKWRSVVEMGKVSILAFIFMPYLMFTRAHPPFDLTAEKTLILKETGPDDSVMVLAHMLPNGYPTLLETGRRDGSSYFFFFPIVMIEYAKKQNPTPSERQFYESEEKRVIERIEKDLLTRKPKLVLIDNEVHCFDGQLTLYGYLQRRQFNQILNRDYDRLANCRACTDLVVFKRKPLSSIR